MKTMRYGTPLLALLALGAAACSESGVEPTPAPPSVAIRFAAAAPAAQPSALRMAAVPQAEGTLAVEGSNGVLEIASVHLIVSEFELDRVGVSCDDVEDEDACEKFEAPPSFVELPLTGDGALAVSQEIPVGSYDELDFEIEDIEVDDDEDGAKAQQIQQLLAEIRGQFPDWPDKAAMLVTGTFTPTGGQPVDFRVYAEAEIEIELGFEPPLEITETSADKSITVQIDPVSWFSLGDGTVMDLSQYDFDATSRLLEFEVEIENGFTKLEVEDDEDGDDD